MTVGDPRTGADAGAGHARQPARRPGTMRSTTMSAARSVTEWFMTFRTCYVVEYLPLIT